MEQIRMNYKMKTAQPGKNR